jgi:hypothetical protein
MYALLESPAKAEVLNSWKDIAKYLKRGVRTVQRWESELALPVRRRPGKLRGGVLAVRYEIDLWLSTCPSAATELDTSALPALISNQALREETSHLIAHCRLLRSDQARLRADLAHLREDLVVSVHQFVATVRAYQLEPAARNSESAKAA